MMAFQALVNVTLRGLLGRRRLLLILLVAALPVLVGVLIRLAGGGRDTAALLDALVVRTVLPLVALIIGTAAIGSEIEDGTALFLLVKPIPRWRVAFAKIIVAAGLTAVLIVPPVLITGALVSGVGAGSVNVTMGFAFAVLVGGTAYATVFTALGAVTSRALLIGLVYILLWEGVLAGLLEGTRVLSIRQATLGVTAAVTGHDTGRAALEPALAALVLGIAIVGGFAWTTRALMRFQVRSAD